MKGNKVDREWKSQESNEAVSSVLVSATEGNVLGLILELNNNSKHLLHNH